MGSVILEATLSFCCSWLVPGDVDMMMMVCVRDITENEQQMREREGTISLDATHFQFHDSISLQG